MPEQLRHQWDILNLLQKHEGGLTLDQIAEHYSPASSAENDHAITTLKAAILIELLKFQDTHEVIFVDDKYKLNLALGHE
jgi:hypothetical protein